jgi:hypothetical protein
MAEEVHVEAEAKAREPSNSSVVRRIWQVCYADTPAGARQRWVMYRYTTQRRMFSPSTAGRARKLCRAPPENPRLERVE